MSHFFRTGNTFKVADNNSVDLHDHLPAGNYIIKADPFGNLFLEMIESFKPLSKTYGDTTSNSSRIISTFLSRDNSTGVLLNGEKGSGKSLLAKTLSIDCATQHNIPTIVINSPWSGDAFNKLIQDIDQPCVVLFDEFEKVYDAEQQESILTLLDGVFPSKKLFVLTCNDKWRIDSHMRNRPGRIFYMLDFKGLEAEFIREYCEDNLRFELLGDIDHICQIACMFKQFNFDMLKALVEEMNRYNESARKALRMLNAKPEMDGDCAYKITFIDNGKVIPNAHPNEWEGNPLHGIGGHGLHISYEIKDNNKTDLSDDIATISAGYFSFNFVQDMLKQVLPQEGKFVFDNSVGQTLTLTRKKDELFHWDAF